MQLALRSALLFGDSIKIGNGRKPTLEAASSGLLPAGSRVGDGDKEGGMHKPGIRTLLAVCTEIVYTVVVCCGPKVHARRDER